ncbi:MAG TPA: DUF6691 family protein [Dehalococcoidia bacterium]|nr:YeeE/YedE thiosulfate transporter family protein [Nevskiaceae bacterium]HZU76071.1 DUF6691 family protein [Dehalococcoidia bacterium]
MTFPLGYTGVVSGLVSGLIFGYALENAGFASACKLTAQLRFQDWAVFKVMFTAILVSATGLYLLQALGLMSASDIYIPTVFLWATLLGGVGVGAGMSIGGYCPGTSVVAFCSGRLDGLMFFLGLVLGTVVFAGAYDWLKPMLEALPGPQAQTLPQLLHLPTWAVLAILLLIAIAVGRMTRRASDAMPASPATAARGPMPQGS